MLRDLFIPLSMKIKALGPTLCDAVCLAAIITSEFLAVYMIMGYRFPAREQRIDSGIPSEPAGTHTGTKRSGSRDWTDVDARRRLNAFLAPSAFLPASKRIYGTNRREKYSRK